MRANPFKVTQDGGRVVIETTAEAFGFLVEILQEGGGETIAADLMQAVDFDNLSKDRSE